MAIWRGRFALALRRAGSLRIDRLTTLPRPVRVRGASEKRSLGHEQKSRTRPPACFFARRTFYPSPVVSRPWFAALAVLLTVADLWLGFFVAPTDATQGQVVGCHLHPRQAAWMSMFIYLVMAFWSAVGLIMNTRLSFVMSRALAPTGACSASSRCGPARCGEAHLGAYWVWDARSDLAADASFLTSASSRSPRIEDPRRADRAGAIIALVGAVNAVIYFSVQWWNTLHQGASVSLTRRRRWHSPCSPACW